MSTAATCGICDCRVRGTSVRAPVVCPDPECQFVACRSCARMYALDGGVGCMAADCSTEFPEDSLADLLGRAWVNGVYRRYKAQCLLDSELARIPESMNDVERFIATERAEQTEADAKVEVRRIRGLLRTAEAEYSDAKCRTAESRLPWDGARAQYLYPCPSASCRGYVDQDWECSVCGEKTCRDCLALQGEGHVCDADDVASSTALRAVSKACPGCACPTERVSGCPQMYCTRCGCRWNWNTHKVHTTGAFHNPHLLADSVAGRANRGGQSLTHTDIRRMNSTIRRTLAPLLREAEVAGETNGLFVPRTLQRFVLVLLSHSVRATEFNASFVKGGDVRLLSTRLAARSRVGLMNKLVGRAANLASAFARRGPRVLDIARRRKRVEYALGRVDQDQYRRWLQRTEGDARRDLEGGRLLRQLADDLAAALRHVLSALSDGQAWSGAAEQASLGDETGLAALVDELVARIVAAQKTVDDYNRVAGRLSVRIGRAIDQVTPDTYGLKPQKTTLAQAALLSLESATAEAAASPLSPALCGRGR